jgi:hypothetical protein
LPQLLYEGGGSYWIGIKAKEWVALKKFPIRLGTRGKKTLREKWLGVWKEQRVLKPP